MLKSIVDGFKDSNDTLHKGQTKYSNVDVKSIIQKYFGISILWTQIKDTQQHFVGLDWMMNAN